MSSASARAVETLRTHVSAARQALDARLPTLLSMASEARVSHVTMLAAVRALAREGELATRRGGGIFLAGGQARRDTPPPQRWKRAAEAIEQAVRNGDYARGGMLPPLKQLCIRYGVCAATLRKSLNWLCRQQLIERQRREYRIPGLAIDTTRNVVALIAIGTPRQAVSYLTQRHGENLRALEQALSTAGLQVYMRMYHSLGTQQMPADSPSHCLAAHIRKQLLGYIVLSRALLPETMKMLRAALAQPRVPLAVLDDSGSPLEALETMLPAHAHVFALSAGSAGGRDMARTLLQLGHRSIAYIGPEGVEWSALRFAGMKEIMTAAGARGRIAYYALPRGGASTGAAELLADMGRCWDSLHRADARSRGVMGRVLGSAAGRTAAEALSAGLQHEQLLQHMGAIIDGVLSQPGLTAIAGANDAVAWACVQVLRGKGVRVPEHVSVAGFDDSNESFQNGISSYNFNSTAAAQAMLNHIVRPLRVQGDNRAGRRHEIRGRLTLRSTTRAVAGVRHDRCG